MIVVQTHRKLCIVVEWTIICGQNSWAIFVKLLSCERLRISLLISQHRLAAPSQYLSRWWLRFFSTYALPWHNAPVETWNKTNIKYHFSDSPLFNFLSTFERRQIQSPTGVNSLMGLSPAGRRNVCTVRVYNGDVIVCVLGKYWDFIHLWTSACVVQMKRS